MLQNRTFQIKMVKEKPTPEHEAYHRMPPKTALEEDLGDTVADVTKTVGATVVAGYAMCRVVHCLCKIAEIRAGGGF